VGRPGGRSGRSRPDRPAFTREVFDFTGIDEQGSAVREAVEEGGQTCVTSFN